jgi:hypothetical protein
MTPVIEQRLDLGELLVPRNLRIDAMQLPQPDLLDPKLLAALDRLLAQMIRAPIHLPDARARPPEPSLRGDEDAAIRIECFADELLRDIRPIGICGVDEIDAELRDALQRPQRFRSIFGRTPDAAAGDAHRAEAEAMDLGIAADLERA